MFFYKMVFTIQEEILQQSKNKLLTRNANKYYKGEWHCH